MKMKPLFLKHSLLAVTYYLVKNNFGDKKEISDNEKYKETCVAMSGSFINYRIN